MNLIHRVLPLLPAAILAGISTAQNPMFVRPEFEATHEGNGTFTYPFGRQTAGMQTILESSFVTNLSTGVIARIQFRPDGENFDTAWTGFTQDFTIQMAAVPTAPQAMTTDTIGNLGGATPVTVFNGTINVPSSAGQPVAPRPFFAIPLTSVFVYNATSGSQLQNLLIDLRTNPTMVTPPNRINIDSVLYRSANIEGDYEAYVTDCTNPANEKLQLIPSKTNLVPAGSVDATLTSKAGSTATPGLFPAAMLAFGTTHSELDLSVVGMNGCMWSPSLDVTQFLTDSGTGFAPFSAPLPNDPNLTGATLYTQAFGLGTSLADSVTSEAFWIKVGPMPSTNAYWPFQMIFSTNLSSWYISNAGPWGAVIGFDGSL